MIAKLLWQNYWLRPWGLETRVNYLATIILLKFFVKHLNCRIKIRWQLLSVGDKG
jgi:hypothetical protein